MYFLNLLPVFAIFWNIPPGNLFGDSSGSFSLNEEIHIPTKKFASNPIYQPRFRFDNNERNTSIDYDLWNQTGLHLFEWPGNITIMDPHFPLLKWEHRRAKLLRSPCESERGMELAVYAYEYLHLTWGANRLTQAYCNPLRVSRKTLPDLDQVKNETSLGIIDFDFIFDGLLVVTKERYLIRITNIEINYRTAVRRPHGNLTYSLPKGITAPITRIISEKCCSKTPNSCPQGAAVLAYQEMSPKLTIFVSYNGGETFKEIGLQPSGEFAFLHGALWYPNWKRIIGVYGNDKEVKIAEHNIDGNLIPGRQNARLITKGLVQVSRIKNEMEFILWDNCSVWYNQVGESGIQATPAIFYLHSDIVDAIGEVTNSTRHTIRFEHCYLGRNSSFQIGDEGKLGFLDVNNLFLYGVDLKRNDFRLVGLATNMSLLLPERRDSIALGFDRNNRPKLFYPPRYLRLPTDKVIDPDYEKRLAMRIVPKTLFPTDFLEPFFEENLRNVLPRNYRHLALPMCWSSSLSINDSVSQKPKSFTLAPDKELNFVVTFKSTHGLVRDLQHDPVLSNQFLNIQKTLIQSEDLGFNKLFEFNVSITMTSNCVDLDQEIFLVNFFTSKQIRCVHQPVFPVWIKIDGSFKAPANNTCKVQVEQVKPETMKDQITEIQHCPALSQLTLNQMDDAD